ncbi:MAG: GTPase [Nitrososphaerota archaeon]
MLLRVCVTGPFNSGKSTLVRTLSPGALSIDARTDSPLKGHTTVLMDYGSLELDGVTVRLLGTPGQPRFRAVIAGILSMPLDGALFLVDSSDPANLMAGRMMYWSLMGLLPVHVVAANKQDRPTAAPPERVREILRVPPEVPVVPLVATRRESALGALDALIRLIRSAPAPSSPRAPGA